MLIFIAANACQKAYVTNHVMVGNDNGNDNGNSNGNGVTITITVTGNR